MTATPTAIRTTDEASKRTVQRRNKFIRDQIDFTSGGAVTKLTIGLLNSFNKNARSKILEDGNIGYAYIDAEHMVSMKANLGLSWEKMKVMAR